MDNDKCDNVTAQRPSKQIQIMDNDKSDNVASQRPRKQKRAELQIYRPGAWRQLKEAASKAESANVNKSPSISKENPSVNNKTKSENEKPTQNHLGSTTKETLLSNKILPDKPSINNYDNSRKIYNASSMHDNSFKESYINKAINTDHDKPFKSTCDNDKIKQDIPYTVSYVNSKKDITMSSKSVNDKPYRDNSKKDIPTNSEPYKPSRYSIENSKKSFAASSNESHKPCGSSDNFKTVINTQTDQFTISKCTNDKDANISPIKIEQHGNKSPTDVSASKPEVKIETANNYSDKSASVWKRELIKGNFLVKNKCSTQERKLEGSKQKDLNYPDKPSENDALCEQTERSRDQLQPKKSLTPVKLEPSIESRTASKNSDDVSIVSTESPSNTKPSSSFVAHTGSTRLNNIPKKSDLKTSENVCSKLFKSSNKSYLPNNAKVTSPSVQDDTLCLSTKEDSLDLKKNYKRKSVERSTSDDKYKISKDKGKINNRYKIEERTYSNRNYNTNLKKTDDSLKSHEKLHVKKAPLNYSNQSKTCSYNEDIGHHPKAYYSSSSDDGTFAQKYSREKTPEHKSYVKSSHKKKSSNTDTEIGRIKREILPDTICDSQINRGVIHLPALSSANEKIESGSNLPQKHLYNPNNPSKPVLVTASPRDMGNLSDGNNTVTEPSKETENYQSNSTVDNQNINKIDPSMLHSLHKGEMDILYYINTNQLPQEFRRIMDIRCHLQNCYEKLLLNNMHLCHEKNIENSLWKSLYYLIIEKLRDYIAKDPLLRERSISTLHLLVNEGLQYLPQLISKLESTYNFTLEDHFKQDITAQPGVKNRIKQAIHSCQKLLLSLGDLARYKEQYIPHPNLSDAKKFYLNALRVQPRNGRPYNQLAIVAVNQKRALDVVYYYIRSLTAANPFISARDSLVSMFEDIKKKYESMNGLKHRPEISTTAINSNYGKNTQENMREETWIRPDSGISNQRTLSQSELEDDDNNRLQKLSEEPSDQIMKQFLTSYLHCHGMLFSRVGLDCFNEVLSNTLDLFHTLLHSNSSMLSAVHLVQIVAVNIFAVENTQIKDGHLESNYRSAAQELALLLAQEMFGKLCQVVAKLLPKHMNSSKSEEVDETSWASTHPIDPCTSDSYSIESLSDNYSIMSSDPQKLFLAEVFTYIPATKIWCDWLLYHSAQWNPPAQSHDILPSNNSWNSVAALATLIRRVGPPDVLISESKIEDSYNVILPEDNYLKGYSLLLPATSDTGFVRSSNNMERARDWLRLNKIKLCLTQFLCGVEPPILRLQKTDQGEIMVAILSVDVPAKPLDNLAEDNEEPLSEGDTTFSDEDESSSHPEEELVKIDSMKSYFIQKDIIEKRERRHKKRQASMAITLQMEIRPHVLIPDTNCFIKHLGLIEKIVKNKSYEMMVPLVVIGELESLSRNTAVEKYGDAARAVIVREGAASGLHFLRSTLNSEHCRNLKCVTSQGSILTSATFTDEIGDQKMTNDDRILSCCMHFFKDNNVRRPIKEGVRRLFRDVVLLTDDIHLRVRAYTKDVPVRNITDFAHWAGIK